MGMAIACKFVVALNFNVVYIYDTDNNEIDGKDIELELGSAARPAPKLIQFVSFCRRKERNPISDFLTR